TTSYASNGNHGYATLAKPNVLKASEVSPKARRKAGELTLKIIALQSTDGCENMHPTSSQR
ncbi:hypothetical protein N5J23_18195, partial [Comamonas aquatica]